jgi:pyridoxal phosphate enzyme (YggS family)
MDLGPIRERIAQAAARAGRDPLAVAIVAVTKTQPLSAVREALEAGLHDVGENRVQEAVSRMDAWDGPEVRWHLIGHLQRNKAKLAAGRFALIHSLDSEPLAVALDKAASARGAVQDVLVQVNVAGEEQKSGVEPAAAGELCAAVVAQGSLRLRGLMTMAPFSGDAAVQRATFRGLRELSETLRPRFANGPWHLSMGMSNDFEVAVEEGATLLRLGTVLYGERR